MEAKAEVENSHRVIHGSGPADGACPSRYKP
jgi:hypothetical protein